MLSSCFVVAVTRLPRRPGAEGMIATHSGLVGGYGLYVQDGKPTFVYNYLVLDCFTFAGRDPLPKGKLQLEVDFAYNGTGAAVTMMVNDTKVAQGQLLKTIPIQISLGEGLDIGKNVGSAVDFT